MIHLIQKSSKRNQVQLKNMLHKEIANTKYLATLTHFWPMFRFYNPESQVFSRA